MRGEVWVGLVEGHGIVGALASQPNRGLQTSIFCAEPVADPFARAGAEVAEYVRGYVGGERWGRLFKFFAALQIDW